MPEDQVSRDTRIFVWMLSIHGIPKDMIKHLYVGDLRGLLIALIPAHTGTIEETQHRLMGKLDSLKKSDWPYQLFRIKFTDLISELDAAGLTLPNGMVKYKFIQAMNTDRRFRLHILELLAKDPPPTLPELYTRLQLYANAMRDHEIPQQRQVANAAEENSQGKRGARGRRHRKNESSSQSKEK